VRLADAHLTDSAATTEATQCGREGDVRPRSAQRHI